MRIDVSWIKVAIVELCLLIVTVRKKQRIRRRAIIMTKIKLERVSKPNQWAKESMGSGKIAIRIKTSGRRSQVREILIEMEFRRRLKKIMMRRISAARENSI